MYSPSLPLDLHFRTGSRSTVSKILCHGLAVLNTNPLPPYMGRPVNNYFWTLNGLRFESWLDFSFYTLGWVRKLLECLTDTSVRFSPFQVPVCTILVFRSCSVWRPYTPRSSFRIPLSRSLLWTFFTISSQSVLLSSYGPTPVFVQFTHSRTYLTSVPKPEQGSPRLRVNRCHHEFYLRL